MKQKTLTILLMLMVAFTQAFGQTFELSPEKLSASDYIYIIGIFEIPTRFWAKDKKDSLYHYNNDIKSTKFYSYEFSRLSKGNCHFFAYDNKQNKYFFYSDNLIGYIVPAYYSANALPMKRKVKEFHIPKVTFETANDALSEVYDMMEKEYKVKKRLNS